MSKYYYQKPTLEIDGDKLELDTTTRTAIAILDFAEKRRGISVSEYLPAHVDILATAFNTTPEKISNSLDFAQTVLKFLEVLTYVANVFNESVKDWTSQPRKNKKRVPIDAVL